MSILSFVGYKYLFLFSLWECDCWDIGPAYRYRTLGDNANAKVDGGAWWAIVRGVVKSRT